LENLSNVETYTIDPRLTVGIIHKIGNICVLIVDSNNIFNNASYGTVLFNIPDRFRPRHVVPAAVGFINSPAAGTIHIESNGNVIWRGVNNISGAVYINVTYLAAK
jgi:hypothetical protein